MKRAAGKQGENSLRVQLEKEAVDDAYGKVARHFEKERKALLARHDKMDAIVVEESHFVAEYVLSELKKLRTAAPSACLIGLIARFCARTPVWVDAHVFLSPPPYLCSGVAIIIALC